jgi:hypothetical protein
LGTGQHGVFFGLPRLSAFGHCAVRLEWGVTRVDLHDGLHRQIDALHRAVVVDPSLAIQGGQVARRWAILGELAAAPSEPLCRLLPPNPQAGEMPQPGHLNIPKEFLMSISVFFIA